MLTSVYQFKLPILYQIKMPVTTGSGAEWSGELMAMMLSIFATLERCQLNPHQWLTGYLNACAENGGKAPKDITPFLPWPVDNSDSRTPIALANSP